MAELNQQVDDLVEKARAKTNPDITWVWKIVGALIVAGFVWYTRYLLAKKSRELAEAKTKLELEKMDAERAAFETRISILDNDRASLESVAKQRLAGIAIAEEQLRKEEQEHAVRVAKVDAVQKNDWDALNKLAGVR